MRKIDLLNPVNFLNVEDYTVYTTEFLVIGTGIAGLRAAHEIAKTSDVFLVTKSEMIETNTNYAQGGIAVVLSHEDDFNLHIEDTLYAGAGLCDYKPVETLVIEGPKRIHELIAMNTNFDKKEDGNLSMTKEAAHSRSRILHAGDTTGAEIERALSEAIRKNKRIKIGEFLFIVSFLDQHSALAYEVNTKSFVVIRYKAVILATGSIGQVYEHTSNPDVATGDGIALGYHFGVKIADMEFVQFHPTTFYMKGAPCFLISESLRGEGGILRNKAGIAFMEKYHERKELAPRDVVSRSILSETLATETECVYLDMTELPQEYLYSRFPNITRFCSDYNIDIAKDFIPVSPAAHYMMGGINVDVFGRTSKIGVYAAGEVAMAGVHGANRLASNSLLEGLVFGKRAGETAVKDSKEKIIDEFSFQFAKHRKELIKSERIKKIKEIIQSSMWRYVGIVRDETGLKKMLSIIDEICTELSTVVFDKNDIKEGVELLNMISVSYMVTEAALERKESRGAHYRTDYPDTQDDNKRHSYIEK